MRWKGRRDPCSRGERFLHRAAVPTPNSSIRKAPTVTRRLFPATREVLRDDGGTMTTADDDEVLVWVDEAATVPAVITTFPEDEVVAGSVLTTDREGRLPQFWGPDGVDGGPLFASLAAHPSHGTWALQPMLAPDVAALESAAASEGSALVAHAAATTDVHGVTDTAELAYTGDPPTAHAPSHDPEGSDPVDLVWVSDNGTRFRLLFTDDGTPTVEQTSPPLAVDSYNRADETPLTAPDVGAAYSAFTGTGLSVIDGTCGRVTSGGQGSVVAVGADDYSVSFTRAAGAVGGGDYMVLRGTDVSNHVRLRLVSGEVFEVVAGVSTELGTLVNENVEIGDRITVVVSGTDVEVFRNGVSELQVTTSVTTGDLVGFLFSGGARVDDFAVESAVDFTVDMATQAELDAEASARAAADALLIPLAQKGAASGVATLDGAGTIPDGQIPATVARDTEVASAVAALVNAAPSTLDTLAELSAALGSDPNFATTMTTALAAKLSSAAAAATYVPRGTLSINIMDAPYGAVAGDTGDQLSAIQSAMVAAASLNTALGTACEVFVPPATFRCVGTTLGLTPPSNVTVRGVPGVSTLHFVATAQGQTCITVDGSTTERHAVTLRDFVLTGSAAAYTGNTVPAFGVLVAANTGTDNADITVDNLDVSQMALAGITGSSQSTGWTVRRRVTRCKVHDIGTATHAVGGAVVIGIANGRLRDLLTADNEVWNCGTTGSDWGIYMARSCEYGVVRGNRITACAGGIQTFSSASKKLLIAHNIIRGCTAGSSIVVGTSATNIDVIGNEIELAVVDKIGIKVDTTSSGIRVLHNHIDCNGFTSTNGVITVSGGTTDVTIEGNEISGGDITAAAGYGIYFATPSTVARARIANNRVRDCQYGIFVNDTAFTMSDVTIAGNEVRNCSQPIRTKGVTRLTIDLNVCQSTSNDAIVMADNAAVNARVRGNRCMKAAGTLDATVSYAGVSVICEDNDSAIRVASGGSVTTVLVRHRGSGSPEGVVTAAPGSVWERTDAGAGTGLYVKESGTGNTGWAARTDTSGTTLASITFASGTGQVVSATGDRRVVVPVTYNPTGIATATCQVEISPPAGSYTTLVTKTVPALAGLVGLVDDVSIVVPKGWLMRLTVVNATIGTGSTY